MKKTIELLKDAKVVKKALAFSFISALCLEIILIIVLKFGIDRYKTYNDPMTWSELYQKLPRLGFIGIGFFFVFFFCALHDKEGRSSFFICTRCLNIFYPYQLENSVCPVCSARVETLKGFYDRHPNLKRRKREKL